MRIVLGVTGCIGAYKAATVLRLLQKEGMQVFPVMTRSAQEFISPLTLEKLSGHRVVTGLFDPQREPRPEGSGPDDQATGIEHITLARQSELLLVAPATANVLGKFAHGIADDFLTTLYLSTTTPVILAPAMNVEMWHHPATRRNVEILRERGAVIVEPRSGYLACGEEGEGRLAEPEQILEAVLNILRPQKSLLGKRVLVTAGPTVEDIDPVRFLSNRSSGRMGYAIAAEAQLRGAVVTLVSGPTTLEVPGAVELIGVRSAVQMADAVFERFQQTDILVMAAAVSDLAPTRTQTSKLKKETAESVIHLERTIDILQELAQRKSSQFVVGFAAESENLRKNAKRKLQKKRLDLIAANDISVQGQGFDSDLNQVLLIDRHGREEQLPLMPKTQVARILWDRIESQLASQSVNRHA